MSSRRLSADPKATSALAQSISPWPLSSPGYFRDLQGRLKRFVDSGQLGPFKNGYWGSKAYRLPPEANLMAVAHYLEALDFQKEIVKIHTIFGGKNPHPNWLVGGVPCPINVDGIGGVGAINMERLNYITEIIDRSIEFTDQVYLPDVAAIGSFYKDWLYGGGLSSKSVLAYGDVPENANDYSAANLLLPQGAIINGNLAEIHPVNLRDPDEIQEFVAHSWYKYPDETKGLHPWDGVTDPHYELGPNTKGTRTNIESLDEGGKYSWIKAPRWKGNAMEVGPLARWIVGYAQNKPEFKEPVDQAADRSRPAGQRPVLDAGTHGGARAGMPVGGLQDAAFPEQADRQHQERRQLDRQCRQVGSEDLAVRGQGRRLHRGPARRAGALDQDQGRQDRELSGGRADHLERQPARSQRQYRRLRGLAHGHAHGRSRTSRSRSCAPCIPSIPASLARPMS